MAPPRKSRSAYKRFSNLNEVSPDKDVGSSRSGKHRKKKLSDMLGPQWSHEELEDFYEAYRKHAKDWRKVAASLPTRTVGMVEALYNMNRAYLSLPEGMASVVGLKAMMTDHYNVLEGSDSDRDSIDATETRKLQKRKRVKVQPTASKDLLQSNDDLANDGCLSLLKRRRIDGIQPRAVGKRTPRFPVSSLYRRDGRENSLSLNRWGRKSEVGANDDDVAHEAALALTTAAHRTGSPQVSQSPFSRSEHMKASPVQSWERMNSQSEATKRGDASLDEEPLEGSIGSRGTETGDYARNTKSLMDMEGVGTVEVHRKGKKFYRKKEKIEDKEVKEFEDGGEACSGTEERDNVKRKVECETSNVKVERYARQGQKKRSKKLFFGDEHVALDALKTLADLSSMMPGSTMESESSVQLKEEIATLDKDDKTVVPEATSANHRKDVVPGPKENISYQISGSETKKLKPGSAFNSDAVSHVNESPKTNSKAWKRKSKPAVSKLPNAEGHTGSHLDVHLKIEVTGEEGNKSVIKGKRANQPSGVLRQWKLVKPPESSSDVDQKGREAGPVVSTGQISRANQLNLPSKRRSRRKNIPSRTWTPTEMSSSHSTTKNRVDKQAILMQDKALHVKEKLSCWLSSDLARRWCIFEWFYSAIDYPWFAKREFVEYLNHVGLGHIPRLTRVEWSVIRSSLGKPRRFSDNFLRDERNKLEQYRECVRKHYTDLRTGAREGLPADLARPLTVGQRVIALHPKTREIHDGSVLTTDHDRCRIQFDRPDIGVEFVKDVDCMPMNPLDNMPEALRRQSVFADKFSLVSKDPPMNGNINISFGGALVYHASAHLAESPMNNLMNHGKDAKQANSLAKGASVHVAGPQQLYGQTCPTAHIQAREADIQALSNLTRALDKQEALLMELRNLNNDILQHQIDGDGSLRDSDSFKKHYATVLVQLKEAGGQASSALVHLRERNTYPGNSMPPWLKPNFNPNAPFGLPSSDDKSLFSQESECNVHEIVGGSRSRAHEMVDTAIKAISALKEGEDAFTRIGEAFDSIDSRQLTSDSRFLATSPEKLNGSLGPNSQQIDGASETNDSSAMQPLSTSEKTDAQIPAELITSCVATLLMIQTCTERHYPPADVARILDSAVSSLHPCCPENLPIYREIQTSMGRLKTQILALVPT